MKEFQGGEVNSIPLLCVVVIPEILWDYNNETMAR